MSGDWIGREIEDSACKMQRKKKLELMQFLEVVQSGLSANVRREKCKSSRLECGKA